MKNVQAICTWSDGYAATNDRSWTSADSGATWVQTLSPNFILYPFEVLSYDSVIISCGLGAALFISSDYGYHWTSSASSLFGDGYSLAINGDSIFLGTSNGLYVTDDFGAICTPLNNGLITSNGEIWCQAITGNDMYAGTSQDGVFYSSDHGANWSPRDSGITNQPIRSIAAIGNFVCAGTSSGVYISINSGITWTLMNGGLGNPYINRLNAIGNEIYACTFDGLFKTSLSALTAEMIYVSNRPKIYPNPSNGNFTISELNDNFDKSSLRFINVLGEEIRFSSENRNNAIDVALQSAGPGIYTMKYSKGQNLITGKIIIQ